jgi:hypothetical protein
LHTFASICTQYITQAADVLLFDDPTDFNFSHSDLFYGTCANAHTQYGGKDCHSWDSEKGRGYFQWNWGKTAGDGMVLGPLEQAFGAEEPYELQLRYLPTSQDQQLQGPDTYTLASYQDGEVVFVTLSQAEVEGGFRLRSSTCDAYTSTTQTSTTQTVTTTTVTATTTTIVEEVGEARREVTTLQAVGHSCELLVGIDYYGNDLEGQIDLDATSADECAVLCTNNALCTHFTFIWDGCYLKSSGVGATVEATGISGDCTAASTDPPAENRASDQCIVMGCHVPYDAALPCQCDASCVIVDDCCTDYYDTCVTTTTTTETTVVQNQVATCPGGALYNFDEPLVHYKGRLSVRLERSLTTDVEICALKCLSWFDGTSRDRMTCAAFAYRDDGSKVCNLFYDADPSKYAAADPTMFQSYYIARVVRLDHQLNDWCRNYTGTTAAPIVTDTTTTTGTTTTITTTVTTTSSTTTTTTTVTGCIEAAALHFDSLPTRGRYTQGIEGVDYHTVPGHSATSSGCAEECVNELNCIGFHFSLQSSNTDEEMADRVAAADFLRATDCSKWVSWGYCDEVSPFFVWMVTYCEDYCIDNLGGGVCELVKSGAAAPAGIGEQNRVFCSDTALDGFNPPVIDRRLRAKFVLARETISEDAIDRAFTDEECALQCVAHDGCKAFARSEKTNYCQLYNTDSVAAQHVLVTSSGTLFKLYVRGLHCAAETTTTTLLASVTTTTVSSTTTTLPITAWTYFSRTAPFCDRQEYIFIESFPASVSDGYAAVPVEIDLRITPGRLAAEEVVAVVELVQNFVVMASGYVRVDTTHVLVQFEVSGPEALGSGRFSIRTYLAEASADSILDALYLDQGNSTLIATTTEQTTTSTGCPVGLALFDDAIVSANGKERLVLMKYLDIEVADEFECALLCTETGLTCTAFSYRSGIKLCITFAGEDVKRPAEVLNVDLYLRISYCEDTTSTTTTVATTTRGGKHTCVDIGCYTPWNVEDTCACDASCEELDDCCADFVSFCMATTSSSSTITTVTATTTVVDSSITTVLPTTTLPPPTATTGTYFFAFSCQTLS